MGKKKQKQKSVSAQTSTPLGPVELSEYFRQLDALTNSGEGPGRLTEFARTGTQPVASSYAAPDVSGLAFREVAPELLSDDQIRSLGGFGATRKNEALTARKRAIDEYSADPSLSTFQRFRANQLTDEDTNARIDAIAKESEAEIVGAAERRAQFKTQTELENSIRAADTEIKRLQLAMQGADTAAKLKLEADLANAVRTRQDLESLAAIYFGGKASKQTGTSTSSGHTKETLSDFFNFDIAI